MSNTQPMEDICKATLAGYHQGLAAGPNLPADDVVHYVKEYVNDELAAAWRIGFVSGLEAAAEAAPLGEPRTLLLDGYKCKCREVTCAGN